MDYLVNGYGPFIIITAQTSRAATALLQWHAPDSVVTSHNCCRFSVFAGSEANQERNNQALTDCINHLSRAGCKPHFSV